MQHLVTHCRLNGNTAEDRLKHQQQEWEKACLRHSLLEKRVLDAYKLEADHKQALESRSREARSARMAQQRSVVGDIIAGKVSPVYRTSKRMFRDDEIPGRKTSDGRPVVPFQLAYTLS